MPTEQMYKTLDEKTNAIFTSMVQISILQEWIISSLEAANIDLRLSEYPAFSEQRMKELDAEIKQLQTEMKNQLIEEFKKNTNEIDLKD